KLDWQGDTLALGLFEGTTADLTDDLAKLDTALGGILAELIAETEFEGKLGSSATTRVGTTIRKLILVGLGTAEKLSLDTLRNAAAAIARAAKQQKTTTLGIALPAAGDDTDKSAQAISEGIILALHKDQRFKSEPKNTLKLETVELLELGDRAAAIATAEKICSGVLFARELVAAPANTINPVTLAAAAEELAREHGLEAEILGPEECTERGMGAYLSVGQASDLPSKFIHLTYKPEGTPRRKLAIVGKGVTFDCGGLNIKGSGSGIETMKMDMGGAGATLGAAKAIGQLKPDVEVHFISAATENMISGRAIHPGDIVTASNGKTIEINNTDAEGRLTLADALVFAEKLEVDAIIDLATLTGACIIALGEKIAGLWSPDEALAAEVKAAAKTAGEKFWAMPMEESYFEGMKSDIADMKNTGPRPGGSITAALFLQQFVKDTPWAHLDVAGPVWAKGEAGVNNSGATGFPVRTLVNWVLS
ncbi:MAG: leucyl aminopeptidase, partial [Cyanobacteria bacterium J06641_5]